MVMNPANYANESCSIVCMRPGLARIYAARTMASGSIATYVSASWSLNHPPVCSDEDASTMWWQSSGMSKIQWQKGRSTVTGHATFVVDGVDKRQVRCWFSLDLIVSQSI